MELENLIPIINRVRNWSTPVSISRSSTRNCNVIYINPALETQSGQRLHDVEGRDLLDSFCANQSTDILECFRTAIATNATYTGRIRPPAVDEPASDVLMMLAPISVIDRNRIFVCIHLSVAPEAKLFNEHEVAKMTSQLLTHLADMLGYVSEVRRELGELRQVSLAALSSSGPRAWGAGH